MDERSGTIRLVEPTRDSEARGLAATVSRAEVEKALRSDEGPVDLLLDVERATSEGRETQRIALGWEPQDLERLLETTEASEISLTFDEGELQSLLDEDVEAHGMRETLAVLTVAAGMAAAGAGSAFASPVSDGALPGGAATPAAQVTASEVSTGLGAQRAIATADQAGRAVTASEVSTGLGTQQTTQAADQGGRAATPSEISTGVVGETAAAPSEVSTGIVQEPLVTPAEVTTGITAKPTAEPVSADQPSWSPSTTEGVALAGTILALTAVGFAMRSRRGPTVAT
jgi:hypothetical protein